MIGIGELTLSVYICGTMYFCTEYILKINNTHIKQNKKPMNQYCAASGDTVAPLHPHTDPICTHRLFHSVHLHDVRNSRLIVLV